MYYIATVLTSPPLRSLSPCSQSIPHIQKGKEQHVPDHLHRTAMYADTALMTLATQLVGRQPPMAASVVRIGYFIERA